jgi:hypothetical protein
MRVLDKLHKENYEKEYFCKMAIITNSLLETNALTIPLLARAQAHAESLPQAYHCIIHGVKVKRKIEQ